MFKYFDFNDILDTMCHEIISFNSDLGVLGDLQTSLFISVDYEEDNNQYKKIGYELLIDNSFTGIENQKSIKIKYCPFCGEKLESE